MRLDVKKTKESMNAIVNLIPGTLVYTGNKKEKFIAEVFSFDEDDCLFSSYESAKDMIGALDNKKSYTWINITGIANVEEIKRVGEFFHINNLVLEQILNSSRQSSYTHMEEMVFSDIQMIDRVNEHITYENISMLLIESYVITFQERKGDVFDSIRDRLKNDQGIIRKKKNDYTFFCLLDAIVDHYIDVIDQLKDTCDKVELRLLEGEKIDYKDLHRLRNDIMLIMVSGKPINKMVADLIDTRRQSSIDIEQYYGSLLTHTMYVENESKLLKESIDSIYDYFMMTSANDMNRIMTLLTVFSAIFIPLSFLAGIFGMNFSKIPGMDHPNGFLYFVYTCCGIAIFMMLLFKKNRWI